MKRASKRKRSDAILLVVTIVLFVALVALTAGMFWSFSRNTAGGDIPFDLDRITADSSSKDIDGLTDLLIPEFIGLTVNGQRYGISNSARAVTDMYHSLSPVISNTVRYKNARNGTETEWNGYADARDSVYIRYHTELPDIVIGTFADISCGDEKERYAVSSYVYEMFVIPGDSAGITVAVRSKSGAVTVYSSSEQTSIVSSTDISKLATSYKTQLRNFTFAKDEYTAVSPTEPVFLEDLTTNNIIISNNIAWMMQGNKIGINDMMRVFSINPDKLLSSHLNDDGTATYTDRSGVLYVYDSAFEYKATDDGGIDVEDIIGYTADVGIIEYISAAYSLTEEIRKVYSNCAGGNADMYLSGMSSNGRTVTVELSYSYDNIRIAGAEPAFVATFKDGSLESARLYTIAVNNTGYRNVARSEWWFFEYLKKDEHVPRNVGLVYRSDFVSNSVVAEWSATIENTPERVRR